MSLFFTKFVKLDPDPHSFYRLDKNPDPHSEKLLDPDPHSEKLLDPDPHKMNADPQPWFCCMRIRIQPIYDTDPG